MGVGYPEIGGVDAMRWGPGPVFFYECLIGSRRWQTYAIRAVGVAVLLAAIASIAMSDTPANAAPGWRRYAKLGESYFCGIIGVELALVILAAPAATAGAICVDRARGTLTHVLATDLSDLEIVLGKLAARMLPVLGLVACSWPVLALSSLLGGIDPAASTVGFAITLAVALVGCTMALALSVWARKPHEVVLVVYTFWMAVMMIWPIWTGLAHAGYLDPPAHWSLVANPYYLAFAPYSAPRDISSWDHPGFFAAALGLSAALVILAVARMRPVARRGADASRRRPRLGVIGRIARRLPGPSLDGHPVLWREWHRSRPSRWLLVLILLVGGGTGIACLIGAVSAWRYGLDHRGPTAIGVETGMFGLMLQVLFGLLMVSASAPTSMAEERQRGSLDLLAVTSLSTPTIVIGKWLGALRPVVLLAIAPAILGFAMAGASKTPAGPTPAGFPRAWFEELSRGEMRFAAGLLVATVLVHGALLASAGVAPATWIARQGRAVAFSVGFAVMVAIGWPFLAEAIATSRPGQGPASLSPILAIAGLTNLLQMRSLFYRDALWWVTFWDVEGLLLALGLLWLTVRTFDACFDRIPERPRRTPVLADVVAVQAVLVGVGGLFGAILIGASRIAGDRAAMGRGITVCILLAAAGFPLLALVAASSASRGRASPADAETPSTAIRDRRPFLRGWWATFRLVPLLAIGPALIALALALAPAPVGVVTKVTKLPGGGTATIETDSFGDTNVATIDASGVQSFRTATAAEIAEATPARPDRPPAVALVVAAVAVLTILAHGAAFVSLGTAMGVWFRRRGGWIAAGVGAVLFVTVGWPLLDLLLGDPTDSWGLGHVTTFPAFLVFLFRRNRFEAIGEVAAWAGAWDAILILVSAVICGLAVRKLQGDDRRLERPILQHMPRETAGVG
jgi:ABC-type Na+ efflux pump permease subunit